MKNFLRFYSVLFILALVFALDGCKTDKKDLTEKPTTVTLRAPRAIESGDTVIIIKEKILLRTIQNKHTVVLLVDTENITHGSPATIKGYCSFQDLNPGDSLENYTTDVLAGDSIIWIGKSISAPNVDKVEIGKIIRVGGSGGPGNPGDPEAPRFLQRQDSINGRVNGIIRHDLDSGYEERYRIRFRVIKEEGNPQRYILDPKIRVH